MGAAARWGVMSLSATTADGSTWPWPTLLVNIAGCFAVGLLIRAPRSTVLLAGTGFAGGLTTFSTFSVEIATLLRADDVVGGSTYLLASVGLGIAAVIAGQRIAS